MAFAGRLFRAGPHGAPQRLDFALNIRNLSTGRAPEHGLPPSGPDALGF